MFKIVDISHHQDPSLIDYDVLVASMKANNVKGVILRSTYGTGGGTFPNQPDTAFDEHYAGFKGKIPIGTYHFLVEYKTVDAQLAMVKRAVDGKSFELGYWLDMELENGAPDLTRPTVIEYMTKGEAFFGELGIYTGAWCWNPVMGYDNPYSSRKLWVASYTDEPYMPIGWDEYWMWQFTSKATLEGYPSSLDMSYIDEAKWKSWAGVEIPEIIEPIDLPIFSQKDSRWANEILGTSSVTIGAYGCLLTAVSSMCKFYGKETNPSKLNKDLIAIGGYENGNLLAYSAITTIYPDIVVDWDNFLTEPSDSKIDAVLKSDQPVIIQVDYNPNTSALEQHWVTIIGKDANGYLIADPIDGQIAYLSRYAGKALRMVVYKQQDADEVLFKAKVICNKLNVRSEPIYKPDGSNIVDLLMNGEVVNVYEERNGWFRIGEGKWCSGSTQYMEKIEITPQPPEEPTLEEKVDIVYEWWKAHPELH